MLQSTIQTITFEAYVEGYLDTGRYELINGTIAEVIPTGSHKNSPAGALIIDAFDFLSFETTPFLTYLRSNKSIIIKSNHANSSSSPQSCDRSRSLKLQN